jgi:hypothetical protein
MSDAEITPLSKELLVAQIRSLQTACATYRAENAKLRELLADKAYIQCKADYNRGHLSHANYLRERERGALNEGRGE